jgi:DNA helicase IV
VSNDLADEQVYVSLLYRRLDDLRKLAAERLRAALGERSTNHQQLSQRDATSTMYVDQIAQYNAVENGLCFGRLDFTDGSTRHIGRIGIHDTIDTVDPSDARALTESDTPLAVEEPLLVDWRAPAARPFYLATVAHPDGARLRRHITTQWREVVGITDETLDLAVVDGRLDGSDGDYGLGSAGNYGGAEAIGRTAGHDGNLASETALLSALAATRTGRMRDIVETIQAEQDEIIRADQAGLLVVEGGPGSGKTAVALHRAAYLLYHHRDTLAKRAVLIVGPNATFLRYIGQVLPGLGETAVVLATTASLVPGVTATVQEPDDVAEIKGRAAMADVIARAVADRERAPDGPWEIAFESDTVVLEPEVVEHARDLARASRLPHNPARRIFVRQMIDALANQVADRVGANIVGGPNLLTSGDIVLVRDDLTASSSVQAALGELWRELTPEQLLADLYADPIALEIAAPQLSRDERDRLNREPGTGWTVADIALLDEAAEYLGVDDAEERAIDEAEAARAKAYAEGVLEILSRDIDDDPEVLMAFDLIDPSRLAERQVDGDGLSVAERAAADPRWAYGHVIVDEAQELSAMAWRALMRRCPSRSMTLVGDVAQTSASAGTTSWDAALRPYVADRWRRTELTVNYRTPAEIMAVAADVLRGIDPTLAVPTSIRAVGEAPWRRPVANIAVGVRDAVDAEIRHLGDGRLAVIVPEACLDDVRAALPEAATGDDTDLTASVVVLTVRQAKGLEFDSVIVVEPAAIVAASPRGRNDLYVAITRATRRLGIVHAVAVPAALATIETVR